MLLGSPQRTRPSRKPPYKTTTLRDFDGGWNTTDNELTLDPRYARILDNMLRAPDGSLTVRQGYELFKDLQTGAATLFTTPDTFSFGTTSGSRVVAVRHQFHGITDSGHMTFSGATSVGGLVADELNTTHSIRQVIDPNNYEIVVPTPATSTVGLATVFQPYVLTTRDTHGVGGYAVSGYYFQDHLIIVMSTGEIVKVSDSGAATRIWSNADAFAASGSPEGWTATTLVSFHVNGGVLLVHNDVDKPLDIDLTRTPNVIYLGDPGSGGSNAAVPLGHLGLTLGGYAIIAGTPDDASLLQFSASLAPGVYSGNIAPDDAVDIDISKFVSISDPTIMGLSELRDKLLVIFKNGMAIGVLGATKTVGSSEIHDPDFSDSISQHGTVSHRSIVALGNDVLMCDRVGIPSVTQSQLSGAIIPSRVSNLIESALQKNISRLSEETLRAKLFAIYNARERQYMLFMPKYDATDIRRLAPNPVILTDLLEVGKFILKVPAHGMDIGDPVKVSGVLSVGTNSNADFVGTWPISDIIDRDHIVLQTDNTFTDQNVVGGGAAVDAQPINEETVGYIYIHNPELKIRAWSRFRNLDFDYGIKTINGRMFFGKGGKVWRFGDKNDPLYGDKVGEKDGTWTNNTAYTVGTRQFDTVDNLIYECLIDHTSAASGSFESDRVNRVGNWTEYKGREISFVWEGPWGDLDKRINVKEVGDVFFDTGGSGSFTFKLFSDLLYTTGVGVLSPERELEFVASGLGGYGAGAQPYGGGRHTAQEVVWPVPTVCKLFKPRIDGATNEPLNIVTLTMLYREGSIGR